MKNNLAIVIPYYKFDFFEETLDSLANQTNKNFNVYIGNDASPNNPENLISKYQDKFNIFYKEFKSNIGGNSLVKQWYRCLDMVHNEDWILILGDDDVLSSTCVEDFYNEYNSFKNLDVIRFASQVIDNFSVKISNIYCHPKLENGFEFLERKLNGGTRSSLSEYIFNRKQLLEKKIKDFPLAWYSDLLLVVELSTNKPIYTINSSVFYFRNSGYNITSRQDNLVKKNQATFSFYLYVIKNYKNRLNPNFLNFLYFKLEKTILYNKKNIRLWLKTLNLYAINGRIIQFIELIFQGIKRIL